MGSAFFKRGRLRKDSTWQSVIVENIGGGAG
jgi:hypothetical protein